jgi:hypothetical protein
MQPERVSITALHNNRDIRVQVQNNGWVKTDIGNLGCALDDAPEAAAMLLGHPLKGRAGQTVEALAPLESSAAKPKSLSIVHGLGSFPMHTDGAHYLQPPRFIVLVCASPGTAPVPTTLIRFRDLPFMPPERDRLEASPFLIRNGRRSFYSTIWSRSRPFVRYDAGCMVPQGRDGEAVARLVVQRTKDASPTLVHWQTGDVIMIDNWNVLHGRGLGPLASPDRKLLRVSVQ